MITKKTIDSTLFVSRHATRSFRGTRTCAGERDEAEKKRRSSVVPTHLTLLSVHCSYPPCAATANCLYSSLLLSESPCQVWQLAVLSCTDRLGPNKSFWPPSLIWSRRRPDATAVVAAESGLKQPQTGWFPDSKKRTGKPAEQCG